MAPKRQYKHIIWDWNGTLLDDVEQCIDVVNEMLKVRGLPVLSRQRYRAHLDFPVIDFYRFLGFDFEAESYKAMANEYIEKYVRRVPRCRLRTGAEAILASLTQAGYTHSVLSAYHQQRLEEAVAHFGLSRWFVRLIGLNDYYAHSKVENGRRWVRVLPYEAEKILFIGDTRHDHEVAQAMGVDCVLLSGGHQAPERLRPCGVRLFDTLGEIERYLLTSGEE